MSPQNQRIAIAAACRWKCAGHPDQLAATGDFQFACQFVINPNGEIVTHHSIPDYFGDLNACYEMEKVLTEKGVNAWWSYVAFINRHNPTPFGAETAVHATAPQRCEAFLRTLGLWEKDAQ